MSGIESTPLTDAEMKALSGDMSGLPENYLDDAPNIPRQEDLGTEPPAETAPDAATAPVAEGSEPGAEPPAEASSTEQPRKNTENVPLAVFMEEKKGRQELEKRLNELSSNYERANARLEMVIQQRQAEQRPAPEAPAIPDPENDVFGATRYALARIKEFDQRSAHAAEQQRQAAQQAAVQEQVLRVYTQMAQGRAEQDPSYLAAQNHLIQSRYNELLADGYDHASAQRRVSSEEFELAYDSLSRKIDPTERIVALAKARGWSAAPAQVAAPTADPAADAAAKLAAVKEGQAASATLSSAGATGSAKPSRVGMKELGDMDDDEFADWLKKNGDKGFRQALGA